MGLVSLDSSVVRTGRLLPFAISLALVAPSPALTSGFVGIVSPASLVVVAVLSSRRGKFLNSPDAGAQQRRLLLPVFASLLLAVSSLADGEADSVERFIARMVAVGAFYSLAMLYFKSTERDKSNILRAVAIGAGTSAILVVAASLRSRGFFGAEILPSRDFILPFGLPKTTGVPRSFGELGLILAGGLATRRTIKRRATRFAYTGLIVSAFLIGQSRNMLVVLAAVVFCLAVRRRVTTLSGAAAVLGLLAMLSPIVASVLVSQSAVREQFVGEGIFERNVDARLSLLDEVSVATERGWITTRAFGANRAEWRSIAGAAPHNHFVSLIVFDGYPGALFIGSIYLFPVLRFGKRANALEQPEFVWIVGSMVALSFYEGAFSASLVVALALFHASNQPAALPDSRGPEFAVNHRPTADRIQ